MAVWVSGAAGKLGSAVVAALRADGDEVVAVDRAGGDSVGRLDLLDYPATRASMAGADAVIHLAAWPSPNDISPTELVENNVMSTFNVFQAAAESGIERVVTASSGSIYGYAWSPTMISPPYLPVDEDSPLQYVDPYALTKDVGERIGEMFARRGMSVVALRLHWILAEPALRERRDTQEEHAVRNFWGYVELADAARACTLALRAALPPGSCHPLMIAAADTMMSTPTADLLDRWYPNVERRRDFTGTTGAFDCSRAARLIGWRPTFAW